MSLKRIWLSVLFMWKQSTKITSLRKFILVREWIVQVATFVIITMKTVKAKVKIYVLTVLERFKKSIVLSSVLHFINRQITCSFIIYILQCSVYFLLYNNFYYIWKCFFMSICLPKDSPCSCIDYFTDTFIYLFLWNLFFLICLCFFLTLCLKLKATLDLVLCIIEFILAHLFVMLGF